MVNYIGLAQKQGKEYWIVFPDFPGCVSCGKDYDELYKNSIEALSLHIDGMKEDKECIPQPSELEDIKNMNKDWCQVEGSLIFGIPYISNQNKCVRVNITLSQSLLNKIDAVSKNRSAFLAQSAEKCLNF